MCWVVAQNEVETRLNRARQSPFSAEITEVPQPGNFKISKFPKYEASFDAFIHVQQYRQIAGLFGYNDAIMCKTFSMNLSGTALTWYGQLAPGTFGCFDKLERAFTSWFVTNNVHPKTVDALFNRKRSPDETLKAYIDRYWEIYNAIEDCD